MQPDFGCDMPLVLFNQQTDDGLAQIQASIKQAVSQWLPFIGVTGVQVTKDPDNEQIFVSIAFTLLTAQGITDSITLAF